MPKWSSIASSFMTKALATFSYNSGLDWQVQFTASIISTINFLQSGDNNIVALHVIQEECKTLVMAVHEA